MNWSDDLNKAIALYDEGKWSDSIILSNKILNENPMCTDALLNRGCAKCILGDIEGAIKDMNKVIKIRPNYGLAYYNRGIYYYKCKSYDLAVKDSTKAIDLRYNTVNALLSRAWCYGELGQYDNAYNDCLNAVKLRYPEYDSRELVTLFQQNQFDKALIAYEKLISAGFEPTYKWKFQKFLLRCNTYDRIILKLENFHVSKTYKRHLRQQGYRYKLLFDSDFDAIMDSVCRHYKDNATPFDYIDRYFLTALSRKTSSTKAVSVALYKDGRLVAGDLGIIIGRAYKSMSGYHDEPYAGTVQLILLAQFLRERGFMYIDFGYSTSRWDNYKMRLGATKITTEAYLTLFASINPGSENIFKKNVKLRKNGYLTGFAQNFFLKRMVL